MVHVPFSKFGSEGQTRGLAAKGSSGQLYTRANNRYLVIHQYRYRNCNDARSRIEADVERHAVRGGIERRVGGRAEKVHLHLHMSGMANSSLSTGG